MNKILVEVDSFRLEEVIHHYSGNGDESRIQSIATTLSRMKEGQTRNERLLPHVSIGNNLVIGQTEALLQKLGFLPAW